MKTLVYPFRRLLILVFITVSFVIPAFCQPGSIDAAFSGSQVTDGANGTILSTTVLGNGKILIAGGFTSYNGTARNYIARLNTDGSLDATFNPGTGPNSTLQTVAVQSDGKMIIAGAFTSFNGTARNNIARLNSDGSLDATFNPGTGSSSTIYSSAVQADGKILIGGTFTTYNGTASNNIARLNPNGSLDTTFTIGTGAGGTGAFIYTIKMQTDGKVIIGGVFTFFNATARNRIARLNSDGSVDATFTPGTGANNTVFTSAIQSDGKIVIGGVFTSYNGTASSRIARLNSDGSRDAGFTPGTGANNTIRTAAVQSDGKIIIGGLFTTYNGTVANRIARLNTDGVLDPTFNTGTGANNNVFASAVQADGKIIIGGLFGDYNGTVRNRIARILVGGSTGSSPADHYRTIASGTWNTVATWESSPVADFSSGVTSPATLAPGAAAAAIIVRGPHAVNVTATVIAAKTSVLMGGSLSVLTGVSFTVK